MDVTDEGKISFKNTCIVNLNANIFLAFLEILQANRIFGSLGELAVMVLPQTQINTLIKRLGK